ncbi:carbohydrate ABC transporter permease [Microbacterium invictum]|uniref:Raffinose/stachyose/melibiose transport system permease protein n=1 Tax=Microbacterium invictum TaxID=515415 RepID=A0AA40SQA0_9MICO|nr:MULTISPECIES: sugar ABC transporter permease [Microbacterium]MBB4140277.1 raffinose/stachyose/melibiose transport system permease protein [Microbacterium invictum]
MWFFILPAVIPYALFVLVPSMQGVWLSFTDWNLLDPVATFIGAENYVAFLDDPDAMRAFGNTVFLVVSTVVLENAIGLGLALGIHSKIKSRAVLRLIFFAPVIIVTVVIGFLWRFILLENGPFNQILEAVGLGAFAQSWLGNPETALGAIAVMTVWQFSGYTMVIYLANLQEVPAEQLEAASLDGAGASRRFWYVVRPLLGPSITVNVVLSTIRGLMIFDIIWVTTQGGPANLTNSLSTLIYRNAFQFQEFGYSLSIAVALSALVAIASMFQYGVLTRKKK